MSFEKLSKAELVRAAEEDFAVDVDRAWPKKKIIEELTNSGVDFAMYLQQNPEQAEALSEVPANVVQEQVGQNVAPPVQEEEPKILIKMLRANPLYEIAGRQGKYRWTQKHPYALVGVADAENILIKEEGFRQATPGELAEYYA